MIFPYGQFPCAGVSPDPGGGGVLHPFLPLSTSRVLSRGENRLHFLIHGVLGTSCLRRSLISLCKALMRGFSCGSSRRAGSGVGARLLPIEPASRGGGFLVMSPGGTFLLLLALIIRMAALAPSPRPLPAISSYVPFPYIAS
ncbi:hypothetical protein Salat_0262100 [Sesamum alatum]|uniref:Uncharacterized protein n=1 Tax=Sesamum alatum TaxID=300844 RepID=A0AAE1YZT7_9LAMI|nr:hypothetical protein Salat_0262100 [Sesamum alatum]